MGYSEMVKENCEAHYSMAADTEQIILAAGRGRDLVDQILTFSRQTETELC